jgi:hypothetical protein
MVKRPVSQDIIPEIILSEKCSEAMKIYSTLNKLLERKEVRCVFIETGC